MLTFLVIIGLLSCIALASYLYERRHGSLRPSQGNDPDCNDDVCGDGRSSHSGSEDDSDCDDGSDSD